MKKLTENQFRQRLIEIYKEEKELYKTKKIIKEDFGDSMLNYIQSALDIIGIVDPTPVTDTINGFIYWYKGDKLFAFLTWVSALPFIGDAAAKPVVIALKKIKENVKLAKRSDEVLGVSDDIIKQIENALNAGDVETFTKLVDDNGGVLKDIVVNFEKGSVIGSVMDNLKTVKSVAKKIPFAGGLVTVIDEWTDIFLKASRQIKSSKEIGEYYTKALKMGIKPLNDTERKLLTQELNSMNRYRGFSDYEASNPNWWNRYYDGGFGMLYGNRDMRALLNRTKWYLGLLDYLNLGNYVGPEELQKQISDINNKIEIYDQTEEAKELAAQDLSGELSMFDKINKIIPKSFTTDETNKMDQADPLNVLFSIVGMK